MQHYLPVLTVIVGAVLLALGGWISGRDVTVLLPKSSRGAAHRAAGVDVRLRDRLRGGLAVVHHRTVPRGHGLRARSVWVMTTRFPVIISE